MRINPKSQEEWRDWLKAHHDKETVVELVHFKKHTGKRAMSNQEAMDEAICFGWIDTTVRRLDKDSYIQMFRRRTSKGKFSRNTKKYAERLIKEGRMSPYGLKVFRHCLKNGLTDDSIPDNPEPPKEFLFELNNNLLAKDFWNSLSPSSKKVHLRWLVSAKREETRDKRIKKMIDSFSSKKRVW